MIELKYEKKKFFDLLTVISASALSIALGLGVFLLPKEDFSQLENRPLAKLKPLTAKSLADGSFFSSVSDYYTDHLPLRQYFTRLKALSELALLKSENNGIIFGKEGYLIPRLQANERVLEENLRFVTTLQDETPDSKVFCFAPVPHPTEVLSSYLPLIGRSDSEMVWETVEKNVEGYAKLSPPLVSAAENGEYVWYRTDHHWTTHGAYLAYAELGDSLGYVPFGIDFFSVETVSHDFLGTSYSKGGCIAPYPDAIDLYRYENDDTFHVTVEESGESFSGFYRWEMLDAKDKYAVFLGGNYGKIRIRSSQQSNRPRLLVIKDSYANALIPFLALHFELDVIDPRYYGGDLSDAVASADRVLLLVGISTLSSTPLR